MLIKKMRVQQRVGEIYFAIAVPAFTISAGSLAYIKAREHNKKLGQACITILAMSGIINVVMLVASGIQKKEVEKDRVWKERGASVRNLGELPV